MRRTSTIIFLERNVSLNIYLIGLAIYALPTLFGQSLIANAVSFDWLETAGSGDYTWEDGG